MRRNGLVLLAYAATSFAWFGWRLLPQRKGGELAETSSERDRQILGTRLAVAEAKLAAATRAGT